MNQSQSLTQLCLIGIKFIKGKIKVEKLKTESQNEFEMSLMPFHVSRYVYHTDSLQPIKSLGAFGKCI